MEPPARRGTNIALRVIYEALAASGRPASVWRRFAAVLALERDDDGLIRRSRVDEAVRSIRSGLAPGGLLIAAEQLGVLAGRGEHFFYSPAAAEEVARALDLAGDSLATAISAESWVPVGTIPEGLQQKVIVPELRQTAGVLLEIIDSAKREVWMTAPFVERTGLRFLADALLGALERGVSLTCVVRPGRFESGVFADLLRRDSQAGLGRLRIFEVTTEVSELGSHAKVCLADDAVCYIGSANLTAHGLGRHLELGARLHGPGVAVIRAALEAIAQLGHRVYPLG